MRRSEALFRLIADLAMYVWLLLRPSRSLSPENLFLRKQLAFYEEHGVTPRRMDPATRITLVLLSKLFDWKDNLAVVQPQTFVRWHRVGFWLLWRWKSRAGRLPIPLELRQLIREMVVSNLSGGGERITNELLLKVGIHVLPRTA
jgi:hypothetical protein